MSSRVILPKPKQTLQLPKNKLKRERLNGDPKWRLFKARLVDLIAFPSFGPTELRGLIFNFAVHCVIILPIKYKNIQDRMSSQGGQQNTMATTVVVREMLELLDNFDRAFGVIKPETEEEEAIDAAYKELYQSVLDKFAELGVEQVETVGTEFDYEVHQAVMQRPSEDYEEGMVCEEFQKGFKIEETLIRAAMVVVAA
mmetsp:Transcript_18501/g.45840  ORF Transcript_18501/g.45840 Transcript_18501/m.45840 type:complete len:198 (-) Transcript_18501:55-648(-)